VDRLKTYPHREFNFPQSVIIVAIKIALLAEKFLITQVARRGGFMGLILVAKITIVQNPPNPTDNIKYTRGGFCSEIAGSI
jgi:hypothetical protein